MATTSTYITPLPDFGFKYIFGREANKDFLISFLNALLEDEGRGEIVDLTFVDKENVGSSRNARATIYDIHCTTAEGKKIIVEMQNRYQDNFKDRALYYLSADIHSQGLKGNMWDYRLTPVYGIFMMNFEWHEFRKEQLREDVGLVNIRTQELFSDKMKMIFLKLPLMQKEAEDCEEILEKWLYLFKNMEMMERIPKSFMQEPVFRRLSEVARVGALSDTERRAYDRSLKQYRDNYAVMQTERNAGRAEGRAEGLAAGRAEGLAAGRAEGRAEEKIELARRMLGYGMSVSDIAQITGLTAEEIGCLESE